MSPISEYLSARRQTHLEELKQLLAIPSVSTDPARAADVRRAAEWVKGRLERAGCTRAEVVATDGHPIVYGEWLGAPDARTILVYGHYDVQPEDPIEPWLSPPFEPTERDGKLFARGAADDKGQFIIHVNALEALLATTGRCPVNVKFVIEGEEEIGSHSLLPFLKQNREMLRCDAVVVSDTPMLAKGKPSICHGLRGLAYLQIDVTGSSRDLHSGEYGGAVANPAIVLTQMLASLKDKRGRVNVPGFYDNVRRLSAPERRAIRELRHSDAGFRKSIAAPELFGESSYTTLERIWARPSLDINGIWAGFTGEGAKTVIPATAHAKISARLVPDQRSKEIARKLAAHLRNLAPRTVKVKVRDLHGGEPWLAPIGHPALAAAGRALKRAFRKNPVFVREGGSIPIITDFERELKVPAVLMGIGLPDDNLHAPNEKIDLDNFYGGIEASAYLMEELAADGSGH